MRESTARKVGRACERIDERFHRWPEWAQRLVPLRRTVCSFADKSYGVPPTPQDGRVSAWFARRLGNS